MENTLIKFLVSLKLSASFVTLSESLNTQINLDLCNLETYSGFHTYGSNMQSGGISFFTKDELVAKKIDSMSICKELIETCTVQVDLDEDYIIIICIYRQNSGTISEFNEKLGGMCDLPIVQNSKFVSNFMSTMQPKYFIPTIKKGTRFG